MQIVRWEHAPRIVKVMNRRTEWFLVREHAGLRRQQAALPQIARRAGGNDILPGGDPPMAARDDVIEGQIVLGTAILALETVAKEDVETGKGRVKRRLYVGFQADDTGQAHCEGRRRNRLIIFGDNVYPIEEYSLYGILPRPQRQGIIAKRPVIRI